ncbi:MAG: hypothetical protein BAA04_13665, partial [Firmicutes bacterium ZCTH02-B6]
PQWQQWDEPGRLPNTHTPIRPAPRPVNPFVVVPVLALLLLGAGMGFLAQRVHVMELGYQLRELNLELARVQDEHRKLQVEVVRARSPERVEALARTRLAMVDPGQPQLVVLAPGPADAGFTSAEPSRSLPEMLAAGVTAVGDWLLSRFAATAEAGSRRP